VITVDFNRLSIPSGKGKPHYRILDVGCGSGRHACAAYRLENVSVTGTDLCFSDVAEAANRLRFHDQVGEHGSGVWCVNVADIKALPFKDAFFDLVICSEVLEHLQDHKRAVRETVRVLRPGGDLVVSVPRYFPERICWALSPTYRHTPGGHVRIYRRAYLIRLLEKAGTSFHSIHHAHSLHTPYWWLKCLLGPHRENLLPVKLYHRFLTWDIMKRPPWTGFFDRLLNPVLGKSVVVYLKKTGEKSVVHCR